MRRPSPSRAARAKQLSVIAAVGVFFFVPPCSYATGPQSVVRGLLRERETMKPVSGSMVALFGPDNSLIDYTYTGPDGSFVLRAPTAPGTYQIEASHGDSVIRKAITYTPPNSLNNISLTAEAPSVWTTLRRSWENSEKLENRAETLLGTLAGTVSGLLLGYFFNLWTNKRRDQKLFMHESGDLRDIRDEITTTWTEMRSIVAEEKNLQFNEEYKKPRLLERFERSLAALRPQLEQVKASKLDPSVVWAARGEAGLKQNRQLKSSVDKLAQFSSGPAILPPPEWQTAEAAFNSFVNNPLLNE